MIIPNQELPYWMAFSEMSSIRKRERTDLIRAILHEWKMNLSEFIELTPSVLQEQFDFSDETLNAFLEIKKKIAGYGFLLNELNANRIFIIPFEDERYPQTLLNKMGIYKAPTLLYGYGNIELLAQNKIAIVGSRKAGQTSLQFTENIARLSIRNHEVVVSGFAKGVDRKAYESAIEAGGNSIIILPQGILQFRNEMKKLYPHIRNGQTLILSPYPANAPWSVGLAMSRNPVIYGMAEQIYVAQSEDSGGTWNGVLEGLKNNWHIYVRKPLSGEKCANDLLIEKGAVAVDMTGSVIETEPVPNTLFPDFE